MSVIPTCHNCKKDMSDWKTVIWVSLTGVVACSKQCIDELVKKNPQDFSPIDPR